MASLFPINGLFVPDNASSQSRPNQVMSSKMPTDSTVVTAIASIRKISVILGKQDGEGSKLKAKSALALLATTIAAATVVIGPAATAGTLSDCPNGTVCLYDYYNFDGLLGYRGAGIGLMNISSANNDKMASWGNKTTTNAAWYTNASGGGSCYTMARNSTNSALGLFERDTASSWKTSGGC